MAQDNYDKTRLRSAYTYVVISVSLVLLTLSILGFLVLNSKFLSDHIKENLKLSIFFKEDVNSLELKKIEKSLRLREYIKSVDYISKDRAGQILKRDLGEDFIDFIGYNPLSESMDIKLKSYYVDPDNIKKLEDELIDNPIVLDVSYDSYLVKRIVNNINKVSMYLIIISSIFILISIILINNSIRLALYSKRFLIKTMQLVGATEWFISKPFLLKSISIGITSSVISSALFFSGLYYVDKVFPNIITDNMMTFVILVLGIFISGIVILLLSTFIMLRRLLHISAQQMHY
ncbi:cell division protein FtsX [Ichthyobacterium seriolicida]|uniref:Cell division protein FtsX n=1 Tax=Ichthyobacterium seriolicida TaxID=242600 RepID=A0A1J1E5B1_9FLAO|nr:permease-like cell division protein FtsX [Ichthyobacterium seriolicida]BAV95244.1 cell division protein FtsX [Ichthyobacterium seriolicida]